MAKKVGQKKIMRVGLIQNQKILEEQLLRTPKAVTIGHDYKKNLLVVPASNLPRTFPLFEWDGKSYILQFTDKMDGRVSRGSGVETLQELREKGVAKKKGSLYQVRLTPTMRGRVAVGEATVLFQFVTPPAVRARPVFPSSMKGGFISGIGTALALFVLLSAIIQVSFVLFLELNDWPEPDDRDIHFAERFAEIMMDEPDEIEEPDLVEDDDEDGDEPAEEDDSSEPEPEAEPEPAEEQTPEEEAQDRQDERIEVTQRVEEETILGIMTAGDEEGGFAHGLTDTVGDISADEAFDGSRSVGSEWEEGDHYGIGGGSPDASGEMAGGEEVTELGGTDGEVNVGSREEQVVEEVEVEMREDAPDDMTGNLDTDALMRGLQRLRSAIEGCYQDHLRQNPSASGAVRILITVTDQGGRGNISEADVAADEVGGNVGQCIANQLTRGRIRLPAPEDGDARITIPYYFSPGG